MSNLLLKRSGSFDFEVSSEYKTFFNFCCLEGRKEMFYLTTHSTHFIYGYMASDHADSERGNPLPPRGLFFPINSKGSFICTIPHTG